MPESVNLETLTQEWIRTRRAVEEAKAAYANAKAALMAYQPKPAEPAGPPRFPAPSVITVGGGTHGPVQGVEPLRPSAVQVAAPLAHSKPPEAAPAGTTKPPTLPDLIATMREAATAKGRDAVVAVLKARGFDSASSVPDDKRAEVIAALKGMP